MRPRAKVTIDSSQEVVYEKSIGTKMNDLDLCVEVVSRSCQPLSYIRRWISRKPLEIEAWFQRTTNEKWYMGYQMVGVTAPLGVTWPMTSRDPQRCCEVDCLVYITLRYTVLIVLTSFAALRYQHKLDQRLSRFFHIQLNWLDVAELFD